MYYVGTLEEVTAIEATICTNAGIPNGKGTGKWADPRQNINGNWCIPVPVEGWSGCTYEDMTQGVNHVETQTVEFSEAVDE